MFAYCVGNNLVYNHATKNLICVNSMHMKLYFKISSHFHWLPPHQMLKTMCMLQGIFFFLKHLCTYNTDNDFAASSNHACINSYNYFFSPPPQNQEWILLKHLVVRSEQKIHLANHREDSNLCGAFYKFILSNTQNGIQKNLCSMSIPHLKLCMFAQLLLQLKKNK